MKLYESFIPIVKKRVFALLTYLSDIFFFFILTRGYLFHLFLESGREGVERDVREEGGGDIMGGERAKERNIYVRDTH